MERPNRLRFDYFSRCFEPLDCDLYEFCRLFGWTLTINPHREPGRDLTKYDRMRLHIGLALDGNWQCTDVNSDLRYSMILSGVFQPVSDLFFYRKVALVENTTFDKIKRDLKIQLNNATRLADEWELPYKTEDGFYVISEGWQVASPHSLKTE